jgi:hypothetical protein
MSYDAPSAASSILCRTSAAMRSLDPVLQSLALSAASIEPLDPNRLPGRRSFSGRKCFWRSSDAAPAPSTKRRVVVFN